MAAFECVINDKLRYGNLRMHVNFSSDHFQEFESCYREQIEKGILKWDLDLQEMQWLSSLFIGMIIGLNTALNSRGGNLRVLVPKKSRMREIMHIAKLDRILNIHEP